MTLSLPLVRVGIPWRPTPDRVPAFEKTKSWYERHGLTVFASDEKRPQLHFNIAAARNHLVKTVIPRSDVYILSDADTIPEWGALKEAVLAVAHGSPFVHLPYHLYRHESGGVVDGACSGILVFSYEAWAFLGGQDEQFRGWGFEDSSFRLAHETLLGPMVRHKGVATAAGHVPAKRDRTNVNRRRWTYYAAALGDTEQMRRLVGEPWPVPPHPFRQPAEPIDVDAEITKAFDRPLDLPAFEGPSLATEVSAMATEVGLSVLTPPSVRERTQTIISPELYQHVPQLNPETQKPLVKFSLDESALREGLPPETLKAMDEGQKAIDAFVRSVAVATDGMSDEQAQAYLDAALERQFGTNPLQPPIE